ncbi:MAG: TetR/AcrR family transcriptional regulator [Chitinophagales bacterium]
MNKKADKILNTTINLFIRDGIKKTTMDDIAENSNVSKVTIYKYFVDKDSLYFEVSKQIFSDYTEKLKSTNSSDGALIKKLYDFLDIISDFANSGKLELCRELTKYNNAIKSEYDLYLQTYRRAMLTLIDEGIENGLIKSNLDRNLIFHYIDMGVVYYQQSPEYRDKMLGDSGFRKQFMLFYISNIFADGAQILSAL